MRKLRFHSPNHRDSLERLFNMGLTSLNGVVLPRVRTVHHDPSLLIPFVQDFIIPQPGHLALRKLGGFSMVVKSDFRECKV
jgi:hypothetical protein